MKEEIIDELGNKITIEYLGGFKIEALEKEFTLYSIVDDDENNEDGAIMIGEIIIDETGNRKLVGIKEEEKDLVMAFYNEISTQLGE